MKEIKLNSVINGMSEALNTCSMLYLLHTLHNTIFILSLQETANLLDFLIVFYHYISQHLDICHKYYVLIRQKLIFMGFIVTFQSLGYIANTSK